MISIYCQVHLFRHPVHSFSLLKFRDEGRWLTFYYSLLIFLPSRAIKTSHGYIVASQSSGCLTIGEFRYKLRNSCKPLISVSYFLFNLLFELRTKLSPHSLHLTQTCAQFPDQLIKRWRTIIQFIRQLHVRTRSADMDSHAQLCKLCVRACQETLTFPIWCTGLATSARKLLQFEICAIINGNSKAQLLLLPVIEW